MLGLFGIFGRSHEVRELDIALRGAGVHPVLVPAAVKLTAVKLLREAGGTAQARAAAAELIAYCMLGPQGFVEATDPPRLAAVEARLERALEEGDSFDARIVLLTLHAGIIERSVVERYALEAG